MLRITGGSWRGRNVLTPEGEATRPSMDAHRLNLMNVIGQDLTGDRVLDLFAGSGAFAFECLSRGAASATLVELAKPALTAIRKNLAAIAPKPGTVELVAADCYALPGLRAPFDIVFIAPPYPHFAEQRANLDRLVQSLAGPGKPLLAADGIAIVQSNDGDFAGTGFPGLAVESQRRWGRTAFTLLRRDASVPPV
ncbi:MAG: RsmD family RNA methyltransferase [Planctomycetes bacterium]|nr:RsmD family RNA methyltransferase [Planctomycetota bacterium]